MSKASDREKIYLEMWHGLPAFYVRMVNEDDGSIDPFSPHVKASCATVTLWFFDRDDWHVEGDFDCIWRHSGDALVAQTRTAGRGWPREVFRAMTDWIRNTEKERCGQ